MTGPLKIPMILSASLVVVLGLHAWAPQNDSEPAGDAIQMTARKYQFEPNLISVKKGEKVRLIITAQDRDHGIKIKAFGINQRLVKGKPTIVEFTAGKAGFNLSLQVFRAVRLPRGRPVTPLTLSESEATGR